MSPTLMRALVAGLRAVFGRADLAFAFSQRNQLPLDGIVTSVSADSLLDDRSGESYYLARVALTGDFRAALDGAELTPGMQADVIIVTGERTALQYLMKPLLQSFNRALREE